VTPNVCSAHTSWAPVVDGIMLPAPPEELLKQVRYLCINIYIYIYIYVYVCIYIYI